jgi:hypothetical protein
VAYQGREILGRLDALERNQTKILVHLGIPPVGRDTLDFGVKNRDLAPLARINEIKPPMDTPETVEDFPLTVRYERGSL